MYKFRFELIYKSTSLCRSKNTILEKWHVAIYLSDNTAFEKCMQPIF